MKKFAFFIILSLLMTLLIPAYLSATTRGIRVIAKTGQSLYLYKNYHALVVGISDYEKWPRLPNAVKDAKEVASKLKELGFEVKLVLDPTSREMKTVLNEMVYKMGVKESRALLFYYAGHGETETVRVSLEREERDPKVIFEEHFNDNSRKWSERDDKKVYLKVENGKYVFNHKRCYGAWLSYKKNALSIIKEDKYYSLEVTIRKTSGFGDSDRYGYGIIWGVTEDHKNYYELLITSSGYYKYSKIIDGKRKNIIGWEQNSAIRPYENDVNKLRIETKDNRIKFIINDKKADDTVFEQPAGKGFGFIVNNCQTIEIEHIIVKEL
jgi:hypothetical protein